MNTDRDNTVKVRLLRRIWKMLPALFLIFLIVLISILFSEIRSKSKRIEAAKLEALHKERPPLNVVVLETVPDTIHDRLDLPAQVEPWIELEILAEVTGKVKKTIVSEGDYVNKGDIIATIDERDYVNTLTTIQAEYDLAKQDLERSQSLFKEQLITKARLDRDVSNVSRLSASLKNAELKLERCNITAPITGLINHLDAEEGLYLNTQDPVAIILDISKVKVCAGIPESDVDSVRRITEFDVIVEALGDGKLSGRKHFLSKSPESFAHLYRLEIEVPNPAGKLLPGMFARVNIVKKEVKDSISVPLYSIINRVNEKYVYVEKDNKAHVRMVETGILEGWKIEVSKGLSQGDRVIVVGHRSVDEGQDINVVRTVMDPEELFN